MNEDIYPLLIEVIKDNSSWIRLTDSKHFRKRYVFLDNCVRTVMSRAITFQASVRIGHYRQGHEWYVLEDDICKAVRQIMLNNVAFARRIENLEITPKDAQEIIYIASHGVLNLNLNMYNEYKPYSQES